MSDRNQAPEFLSAEELRNRLYHSLRNRGLVDSIKSQLRNSLVTELQQSVRGPLTLKDLKGPEEGSLLQRASNSLVANHMRACQYEYSLSVFLPECGLNQDKRFDTADLLKLLNISPHSRLHQRLASHSQEDSKKGFLWQLLSEVSSLHANSITTIGCQTDLIKMGPITPLEEKLSDVDELYSSRREDYLRNGHAGAEERLLSFQRQLEDRYNTQLKMEIARMRDAEISTIKMNEKENSRKATEQARRELERLYKEKHVALVNRERNASERLQQQTEIQERETYAQRQSILEEIEAVRQREAEVKREAEVNAREKKLSEKRVKDKEEDLRRRELEVKQKENSFEQRLQNEMAQFKLDQQARYIERIQNVEVREATLKEQERIVSDEKARLQQVKDELRDKTHRVNELETQLSEVRFSEVNANKNNEYLNAKLRDMSDYKTLKEQAILYRNELETVRTRLAEVLSMNERERGRQEELLRELRRPSPESLMLHRDLERSKEELRQEQAMFTQQKQLLETRLKEELDRNRDLVQRFEEQNLQMREMNREVVDLRQQLHMTTKALNNEVYRQPNDNDEGDLNESRRSDGTQGLVNLGKSSPSSGLRRPGSGAGASRWRGEGRGVGPSLRLNFDTKDIYHDADTDIVSVSQRGDALYYGDEDVSSADSADIIAQAKYRLRSLDKEAHNLERAYHDFHCRVTNINALPNEEPIQPGGRKQGQEAKQPGGDLHLDSPRQSPIPFEHQLNPMSSTPYKQARRKPQEFNDSFAELATRSGTFQPRADPPVQSHGKGDLVLGPDRTEEERKVKVRPITMDDLERRPGSPEIVVVPGSVSSEEGKRSQNLKTGGAVSSASVEATAPKSVEKPQAQPSQPQPLLEPAVTSYAPPPQFSLDDAWRTQLDEEEGKEKEAQKRQREMEAELEREQERKKEEEKREEQRKQEEEAARAQAEAQREAEDKIDPVMKQYMAMVQQQKEQEKQQSAQRAASGHRTHSRDRTPSQSEADNMSIGGDDGSEDADW